MYGAFSAFWAAIQWWQRSRSRWTEFFNFAGIMFLVFFVSALVTGGHAQEPTYHESPMANGMINLAARYVPLVHGPAIAKIEARCVSTLGVSGVGQRFLSWDDAAALANDYNIPPFIGLGGHAAGATANTNLVIIDSVAGTNVCCNDTFVVPGSQRPCERMLAGVGGLHQAKCEAEFIIPVQLEGGGSTQLHFTALIVPECPHHLISACTAAAQNIFGLHIGRGDEATYLDFGDGRHAPLINAGVLILPDAKTPVLAGMQPQARASGTGQGLQNVNHELIHLRYGHGEARHLVNLPRATDAPSAWATAINASRNCSCDACLRDKAHELPS